MKPKQLDHRLWRIHPAVLEATPEELLAAGWGDVDRCNIPHNWRTVSKAKLAKKVYRQRSYAKIKAKRLARLGAK